jgi:hypothetical protein
MPRSRRSLFPFLALALGFVGDGKVARAECCPGVREGASAWPRAEEVGNDFARWVKAGSSGDVFLVWGGFAVNLLVSRDDGWSWEPSIVVLPGVATSQAAPVLDSFERLVIPYWEETPVGGYARAVSSTDRGRTFSRPQDLGGPLIFCPSGLASATGVQGITAVSWIAYQPGGPTSVKSLQVTVTEDGGASWRPATTVHQSEGISAQVLVVTSEAIVAGWMQSTASGSTTRWTPWTSRSLDGGRTWSVPVAVTFPETDVRSLTLGYTRHTNVVALTLSLSREWRVWTSGDGAASWAGGDTLIGLGNGWGAPASMLCTEDGHVHVVWTDGELKHRGSAGDGLPGTWQSMPSLPAPGVSTVGGATLLEPLPGRLAIVQSYYGREAAPCGPGATCQDDIYLEISCDDGQTWSPSTHVDAGARRLDQSAKPEATASSAGVVHVAWADVGGSWWDGIDLNHVRLGDGASLARTDTEGLLHVAREGDRLRLEWDDPAFAAEAYNVYSGLIGTLNRGRRYDHAASACHVLRRLPPQVFLAHTPPGDAYYLVSGANCSTEGGMGTDSFGRTRPVAGTGAPCGPMP